MNLVSHILVAIIFLGAFFLYVRSDQREALIFAISAGLLLVLVGLPLSNVLWLICVAWSITNILLITYMLLAKKRIKIPSIIIVQIILFILWGYFRIRT